MRNLGILWILYGLLRLIGALSVFLYSGTLRLMWGALLSRVPDPFTLMRLFQELPDFHYSFGYCGRRGFALFAGLNLMSSAASARTLGLGRRSSA
jgi:hypothetical protein